MKKFQTIILLLSSILILCLLTGCQESEDFSRSSDAEPTAKSLLVSTETGDAEIKAGAEVVKTAPVSESTQAVGKPMIEVINPVIDFGKLSPKDKVTGEFKFKNSGTGTLKITTIKSSCGCAVINRAKMKKVYEPGESGSFKITYTGGTKPGPAVRNVTIFSNAANKPTFICRIKARIVAAVSTEPKQFNISLRAENGGIGPLKLKSTDGEAFKIINFLST
ncbi:MAG: DUF1573 domain-containing protein, partial [Planctomycetes bacterium]|nr:DUF1573 domain-containing protein [Planctomycetota bacterium]